MVGGGIRSPGGWQGHGLTDEFADTSATFVFLTKNMQIAENK